VPDPTPQLTRRVLVVEDEFLIADDLMSVLSAANIEVIGPAHSIGKALSLLATSQGIDAAVLDVNLKGQAAFPIAEALMARGIPFVFTTGYDRRQLEGPYRDIVRFEKPFDPRKIVAELLKIMRP
jgi:DNA-binding response OmpR family regulator